MNPNYVIQAFQTAAALIVGVVTLSEPKTLDLGGKVVHALAGDCVVIDPITGKLYFAESQLLALLLTRNAAVDASVATLLDGKTIQA